MIKLNQDIIDDFSQKIDFTKGKLNQYLDKYFDFYEQNYPLIVNFFSGKIDRIEAVHFEILNELIEESERISQAIIERNYLLGVLLDWEMVDYLEDLKMELYVVIKISKFLRSSKTNYDFIGVIEIDSVQEQNQTLEGVSRDSLLSENYDNDWIAIAIRNDLSELDYDLKGGKSLILAIPLSSSNANITGVIDNIIGERILGRDIQKKIEFVNNDLKVLGYKDTAFQSVEILGNLKKGQVPEFFDLGRSTFIGKSSSALGISSVIREMVETFSSDDTLANFSVRSLEQNGDAVFMKYFVSTKLDLIIDENIQI